MAPDEPPDAKTDARRPYPDCSTRITHGNFPPKIIGWIDFAITDLVMRGVSRCTACVNAGRSNPSHQEELGKPFGGMSRENSSAVAWKRFHSLAESEAMSYRAGR